MNFTSFYNYFCSKSNFQLNLLGFSVSLAQRIITRKHRVSRANNTKTQNTALRTAGSFFWNPGTLLHNGIGEEVSRDQDRPIPYPHARLDRSALNRCVIRTVRSKIDIHHFMKARLIPAFALRICGHSPTSILIYSWTPTADPTTRRTSPTTLHT
jgi:hypothetical protein